MNPIAVAIVVILLIACSIHEIGATDIPEDLKRGLRALAHDLSGSLVFDYGKK